VTRRTKILIGVGAAVAVVVLFLGWQGVRALIAWNSVERVEFDTAAARAALPPTTAVPGASTTTSTAPVATPVEYQAVLVIGSDERVSETQDEAYADAVLLYLRAEGGGTPTIVSIPRDLVVIDPCTGRETKLDRTLVGCDEAANGAELVSLAVEDYTGIPIDYFALLKFEALVEMVDSVGGVQLCSDYALREGGTDLLPAGCSTVDGEHALAWIRSRRTQEQVDGEWRFMADAGDAARVERQQLLMFALLDRLKTVRSPVELAGLAEQLDDTIILSDTLGIGDAVALAWELRPIPTSEIRRFTVPTEPTTLPDGSFAVRAIGPFAALMTG
jgi:LCP family protein required for cell wall assembly